MFINHKAKSQSEKGENHKTSSASKWVGMQNYSLRINTHMHNRQNVWKDQISVQISMGIETSFF